MDLQLTGKRAVVAGASRGIGLAVADALAAEGADVRWSTFAGGHEIPLQAWVALRRLVRDVAAAPRAPGAAGRDL